jgi:hypothetical protein
MRGGGSVALPLLDRPCAHFAGQHTSPWDSPLAVICDSKFPLLGHARAGGGLPKQQPKTKPMGVLLHSVAAWISFGEAVMPAISF